MPLSLPCSKGFLVFFILLLFAVIVFRENYLDASVAEKNSLHQVYQEVSCARSKRDVDNDRCMEHLILAQEELFNLTVTARINGCNSSSSDSENGRSSKSLAWGPSWESNKTGGHIETTVVSTDCLLPGSAAMPVCCAVVNASLRNNRGVGIGIDPELEAELRLAPHEGNCIVTKIYFPSEYEKSHIDFARTLAADIYSDNSSRRLNLLLEKVTSKDEYEASLRWLARVKAHMQSEVGDPPVPNEDDEKYLSYFEITRNCTSVLPSGESTVDSSTWRSWIEPLILQSRHPFAYRRCRHYAPIYDTLKKAYSSFPPDAPRAGMNNIDYVLLQSGPDLLKQNQNHPHAAKHYLLDAGTSTFDSSLWWFTCAYSQRRVDFDAVYGWELTPLHPSSYWEKVPSHWRPFWHFYNTPIKSARTSSESPLQFIKQIATERDFVSFKIDIDSPHTEIPLFEQLLEADSEAAKLIDEFFFELHYRCEVMMPCGWGNKIPDKINSIKLDRLTALESFSALRKKGIRAHFWP